MAAKERRGYLYALLAVALFSSSPVLVRWAASVSSFEITFWRLSLATLTVFVLARATGRRVPLALFRSWRFVLYGLVIALHFFLYVASLFLTSVAHALALVYTAPLFIAVLSRVALGEALAPRQWAGVGMGVAGVAILSGFQPAATPRELVGDALAVGSAVAFAVYSVVGRAERARVGLLEYAAAVYGWGALWLLPAAALAAAGSRYDARSVLSLVGLGIGPLGTGHTLYNAALRRISATSASLIATLEVVGGVLLSALLLGELPAANSIVGAAVILAGIVLVLR